MRVRDFKLEVNEGSMEVFSALFDKKIMGVNVVVQLSVQEYLNFAPDIIKNNDLQRAPVRSEGKPYELLRRDLISGCVIPPIILAISGQADPDLTQIMEYGSKNGEVSSYLEVLKSQIDRAIEDRRVLILDGLQRTLTLLGISSELSGAETDDVRAEFLSKKLRFEVYLGLSKQGILYRMLTLNTGQTPMSFRHQLEILYYDYLDGQNVPIGIEVVKEIDEKRARGLSKYKYSDVVELFYAFSTGSPLPYDKQALISNLREMSFLESFKYDPRSDQMGELLSTYNKFCVHLEDRAGGWAFDPDSAKDLNRPFGTNIASIFSRTQPMAAFGAECKGLIEKGVYASISEINSAIDHLAFIEDPGAALNQLLVVLNQIGSKAKKIGDAQRFYFQLAFRELLMPQAAQFQNLSGAWVSAQEKYEMLYT